MIRNNQIIPFIVTIPEEKQDRTLHKKIIDTELPGILNWVLRGLERLLVNKGFSESKASKEYLEEFKINIDPVRQWLDEYEVKPGNEMVYTSNIYSHFKHFITEGGFQLPSVRSFSQRLLDLGFTKFKDKKGRGFYLNKNMFF